MTPEQKSRQQIDRQPGQAGWRVQDYRQMNITSGLGVAVREFPLTTGFADYMLYADAKAIGSVEAKPEGFGLMGVADQSTKYSIGLPKYCRIGKCHFHLLMNQPELNVSQRAAGTPAGESLARRSKG